MSEWTRFVTLTDDRLARRYSTTRIPMSTLLEAYLDGTVDIPDMDAFLMLRSARDVRTHGGSRKAIIHSDDSRMDHPLETPRRARSPTTLRSR